MSNGIPAFEIGTLKVDVIADTSQYKKELKEAEAATQETAKALNTALGPAMGTVGQKATETEKELGKVANTSEDAKNKTTLFGSALGMLSSGLGIAVRGLESFFGTFVKGIQDIERTSMQATRLGITISELRTAMTWGGAAGSSVVTAISSVQSAIRQASIGTASATRAMQSLTAASGMDVQAKSFSEVVSQLEKIEDPAKRAAFAFGLMGENAIDLLDVLNKPGGMAGAAGFAQRAGILVSDADLANAKEISQTIRDLQTLWQGFINQVILGIAPFVRAFNEMFDARKIDFSGIKTAVIDIGERFLYIAAYTYLIVTNTKAWLAALDVVRKVIYGITSQFKAGMLDALAAIADAAVKVAMGPLAAIIGKANTIGLMVSLKLATGISPLDVGASIRESAGEARKEADKRYEESGKLMEKFVKNFAKEDPVENVRKFMESVRKLAEEVDKTTNTMTEAQKKMAQDLSKSFESIIPGIRQPGGGFVNEMQRIFQLMGRRTIEYREGGRPFYQWPTGEMELKGKAIPDYWKGPKGFPGAEQLAAYGSFQGLLQDVRFNPMPNLAPAATYRTQEAVSAEAQFQLMSTKPNIQEQIRQALELANEQRQRQIQIGDQVLIAIRRLAGSPLLKYLVGL